MSLFSISKFPLATFSSRLASAHKHGADRVGHVDSSRRSITVEASNASSDRTVARNVSRSALLRARINTSIADQADDLAIDAVTDCKGEHTISVCIPAHNEEPTIGAIVTALRQELMVKRQLVDEIIVMDDRSTDDTARAAQGAGALVFATSEVCVADGPSQGKGDALARSVVAARGSILVWVDGDLQGMAPSIVARLVAPLLLNHQAHLTKGYFTRKQADGSLAGGRVTELVAKPLLRLCFPNLIPPREPLSGMCAIRRTTAERLSFERDFGVDIGVVLDVYRKHGRFAIVDVDLGEITHRHHELSVLSVQATAVARSILSRAQHPELAEIR
jgi:glucosyl-3-phosphoglycerate synthase